MEFGLGKVFQALDDAQPTVNTQFKNKSLFFFFCSFAVIR